MPRLGDLEREVMDQLWDATAPLTVREIHEGLARGNELAYTTVMTVLDRLTRKGLTDRERDGRAFRYVAVAGRDQLAAELMQEVLSDTGADRTAALVHFAGTVSPAEAKALQEALARVSTPRARRRRAP